MQSLPMRRRMWWLWHWLDRDRSAVGSMRRLLCIVGPVPLVLDGGADCVSTGYDFIGRARDRPGQFLVFVVTFACQRGRLAGDKRVSNSIEQF